jgi:hypothetical protein
MRQDDGLRLEDGFAAEDSAQFLRAGSDSTLEAIHDRFYNTLRDSAEHTLRDALPDHVQRLLAHICTYRDIACA